MKTIHALTLLALFLTGCASARKVSLAVETEAKKFIPKPGKAALYVYYNDAGDATDGPLEVFLSPGGPLEETGRAEEVTMLPGHSFARIDVPPGEYGVVIAFFPHRKHECHVRSGSFTMATDRTYFLDVVPQSGIFVRPEESAKGTISSLSMVELTSEANDREVLVRKLPSQLRPYKTLSIFDPDGSAKTYYIQRLGLQPMDARAVP
ncbi:MAG: hypothetical protein EXS35_06880 [Pedosphaera sp.]|nr:hypothetical protein [Pedosphaera sp.]